MTTSQRRIVRASREQDVLALVSDWKSARVRLRGSLYVTPEWVLSLWESHFAKSGAEFVAYYEGPDLMAVFPMVRRTINKAGVNFRHVEFLANCYGQNHNELAAFPCSPEVASCLLGVLEEAPWDILSLTSVPEDSSSLLLLERAARERGLFSYREDYVSSPFLHLEGNWDSFLAARSSNFRSDMRRKLNKAKSVGLHMEEVRDAAKVPQALEAILDIEARSWKHRGGTSITAQEPAVRFYRTFLPTAAENGWLRLYFVYLNEQPIAYDMGVLLDGKYYMLKTGFDEAHGQLSPGVYIRQHVIRALFDEGATEHDFLGDADSYKLRWTSNARMHFNLYVCNTRRYRARLFSLAKVAHQKWATRPSASVVKLAGHQ